MAKDTEGRPSPEVKPLEESQLSTNFFWKIPIDDGKHVFDMQTTIRNIPDFNQVIDHCKVVKRVLESIIQAGGFPKPVSSSAYGKPKGEPLPPITSTVSTTGTNAGYESVSIAGLPPQPPIPSEPEYGPDEMQVTPALQPALPLQPQVAGVGVYDGSFPAEFLTVKEEGGKKYFKVKGAPYHKFGIKVWPEVLKAAHIDPDTLSATSQDGYDLVGYTAYFINQKEADPKTGKIYPEKVIALRRN